MSEWYIARAGSKYGPYNEEQFRQMVTGRQVWPNDLLFRTGWTQWVPAHTVFGLNPPPPALSYPAQTRDASGPMLGASSVRQQLQPVSPPSRLDRVLLALGAAAPVVSIIIDVLQPVVEMTGTMAAGSLIFGSAAYIASRYTTTVRTLAQHTSFFFAVLFACSTAFWGLQHVIPDGRSKGAIAGIVPGIERLQASLEHSMLRVESHTKRVGDLLEEQAQRQLREQEDAKREREEEKQQEEQAKREAVETERQRLKSLKAQITEAGYSLDADGLVKAHMEKSSSIYIFQQLGIKPTETAIARALRDSANEQQAYPLLLWILSEKGNSAMMRSIYEGINEQANSMRRLFETRSAKSKICSAQVKYPISSSVLKMTCSKDGAAFAGAYAQYYGTFYGIIANNPAGDHVSQTLHAIQYSLGDLDALPIVDSPGLLQMSKAQPCTYYRGNYRFYINAGLNPFGSFETHGSANITYFSVADRDFDKYDFRNRCSFPDVVSGRRPQCTARVLMVSRCPGFGDEPVLIKVLP